jgi:hypothetical protein
MSSCCDVSVPILQTLLVINYNIRVFIPTANAGIMWKRQASFEMKQIKYIWFFNYLHVMKP